MSGFPYPPSIPHYPRDASTGRSRAGMKNIDRTPETIIYIFNRLF